jgi:glycosyltransferase involved in cell wall biosynthesis
MSRRSRILVVNDYPLADSWRHVKHGISPSHFLYGVDHLERRGHHILDVSGTWSRSLASLDRHLERSPLHLGSLDLQAAALPRLDEADVIYSPCHLRIHLLCHARALGILRQPIVWLAHHPVERGRLAPARRSLLRHLLRGASAVPSLSDRVTRQIDAIAGPGKAETLAWGPDPRFYPPAEYPGSGFVVAGRTGRDWALIGRAARRAGVATTVICQRRTAVLHARDFAAPNIQVLDPEVFLEYRQTAKMFARCRALVIPMLHQDGLCGLSSLMDGLGGGKPLLVTRNAYLDLDVERLGIGMWIDPGDEEGWVRALRHLDERPAEAAEMGRRARALVDAGMDIDAFSRRIADLIERNL